MSKILEIALSTKFNAEQIPGLMEVMINTPNVELATEILLGLYEEPTIDEYSIIDNKLCKFVRYNKWGNDVTYTYTTVKVKRIYVKKDVPEESITAENYKEYIVGTNGQWIDVKFPNETETKSAWTQLSSWESGASKVGEMQP